MEFKGNNEDLSMLLVSAERYALGRRTYIVGWTCNVIMQNIDKLTENDKKVIINDIKGASSLGDKCDEAEWYHLLSVLE